MFEGVDWTSVGLAATVATAFATGISTLTALWWRRQDRARPDWFTSKAESLWKAAGSGGYSEAPNVECTLSNTGDAPAFRVQVAGLGCRARLYERKKASYGSLEVDVPVWVMAPPGSSTRLQVICEPDDWHRAAVRLTWVQSPTWKNRTQVAVIPLSAIGARPTYVREGFNEANGSVERVPTEEPARPVLGDDFKPDHPLPSGRARTITGRRHCEAPQRPPS